MDIKTPADWWKTLDDHWADILTCASYVGADLSRPEPQFQHLADTQPFAAFLEAAKTHRDRQTVRRFLGRVWMAAPDRSEIHSWPSWGTLCDLCSEDWVFEEEAHDS